MKKILILNSASLSSASVVTDDIKVYVANVPNTGQVVAYTTFQLGTINGVLPSNKAALSGVRVHEFHNSANYGTLVNISSAGPINSVADTSNSYYGDFAATFSGVSAINHGNVNTATFMSSASNAFDGYVTRGQFATGATNIGIVDFANLAQDSSNNGIIGYMYSSGYCYNLINGNIDSCVVSTDLVNTGHIDIIESTSNFTNTSDGTVNYVMVYSQSVNDGTIKYAVGYNDASITGSGTITQLESYSSYSNRVAEFGSAASQDKHFFTSGDYNYCFLKSNSSTLASGDKVIIVGHVSGSYSALSNDYGNCFLAVNETFTYNGDSFTTNSSGIVI